MVKNIVKEYMTELSVGGATVWLLALRGISEEAFQTMYACCDKQRQEKADGIKPELKKKQSVGAGYLLFLLKERFFVESGIVLLPGGKPVFRNNKGIFFSISHSGEYAALAFGNRALGLDMEYGKAAKENVARRFFTKEEYEFVLSRERAKRDDAFFRIWTGKEALIKADGRGLTISLDSFSVLSDEVEIQGRRYGLEHRILERNGRKIWISAAEMLS